MNKNTLIGLLLVGAILFGYTWFTSRQGRKYNEEKARQDSIARVERNRLDSITRVEMQAQALARQARLDSLRANFPEGHPELEAAEAAVAQQQTPSSVDPLQSVAADSLRAMQLGQSLFTASKGAETLHYIENDLIKVGISTLGGKIYSVELKDYNKYSGDPIQMYAKGSAEFDLNFFVMKDFNNLELNTADYYFTAAEAGNVVVTEQSGAQSVAMRLFVDANSYIEYRYTLTHDDYMVDFDIDFVNMKSLLSNQSDMVVTWKSVGPQNEKGFKNENNYTTISYKVPGEKKPDDIGMSEDSKSKTINSRLQWIAFKQQFFSSIFVAEQGFENAQVSYSTFQPYDENIKKFEATMAVPFNRDSTSYRFNFYFGPNKYKILKSYKQDFQRLIPLGGSVIGIVNRAIVIPVFDWLEKTGMSYGLIILILTIMIKLILFPFTYRSYLSTAKMRVIKPEVDEINERYPKQEDAMKKQQATMELYKKAGINPMGGCLPLLVQFPILIAMFRFFPASIELRGQSFLWADDLSSYDSILNLPFNIPFYGDHVSLFTLFMAVTMHISSRISYAQSAASTPQMGGMKFMMLWLMPIMMMLWFNNYASGLSYYYTLSSIITILQTVGIRYAVNEDKLHARMKAAAASKKPKKKSKWQQRYDTMVKAQQEQARQQQGKKKR